MGEQNEPRDRGRNDTIVTTGQVPLDPARPPQQRGRLTRREWLAAVAAAGATLPVLGATTSCAQPEPPASPRPATGPRGTPSDPDLIHPTIWWTKQLTTAELATLAALCDTIIPADEQSPSASAVGVTDYINEWASAPYDWARDGQASIRKGLAWLDVEAGRRFGKPFASLAPEERNRIADDICYLPRAKPEHREAASFFDQVRDLTATGFYTTTEGMKDLGYVGNVPLDRFDGPPPEVLRHLKLDT